MIPRRLAAFAAHSGAPKENGDRLSPIPVRNGSVALHQDLRRRHPNTPSALRASPSSPTEPGSGTTSVRNEVLESLCAWKSQGALVVSGATVQAKSLRP